MKTIPHVPATPEILIGYCGPIEWAMLDAPGDPVWRRAVWGPIGPSSEPERMGVVNAGDMRGNVAMRLPLAHPLAMCHAKMWLATRLGAVAPSDVSFWRTRDPYGRWSDRLRAYDLVADGCHVAMFVDREVSVAGFKRGFSIPGLSNMSYPEVVAAACVAVGGAS
jgi:hypothetical protein